MSDEKNPPPVLRKPAAPATQKPPVLRANTAPATDGRVVPPDQVKTRKPVPE